MKIHSHDFNVMTLLQPIGRPLLGVYLGVELEMNVKRTQDKYRDLDKRQIEAEKLDDLFDADWAVVKHDGSVGVGFEIVSAPAGVSIHRKKWKEFFNHWPKDLHVDEYCGMHVHFSRQPFETEQLREMHKFFTEDTHRKKIEVVAGRKENHYTKFIKKRTEEDWRYAERYEALNLVNRNTVEVRIFASTKEFSRFLANLEFVAALAHKSLKEGKVGTWTEFREWVGKKERTYPEFAEFLQKVKL